VNNLSDRLAKLSPEQRKMLLAKIQQNKTNTATIQPEIQDTPTSALSSAQEQMMILYQMAPDSSAYNISAVLKLEGNLNITALKQSFLDIINRHQSLRTYFQQTKDQIIQTITPYSVLEMPVRAIPGKNLEEKQNKALKIAEADAKKSFDLFKGPLLKTKLLELSNQKHILLVNMHHIISDGWSMGVLIKELGEFYTQNTTGTKANLPELTIQYSSFANWQKQQLKTPEYKKQLTYWKEKLSGELPILNLPINHPRQKNMTFNGAKHIHHIPADLAKKLQKLSQENSVSLFMSLMAIYKTMLFRYTMEENIIVGTPLASRSKKELENLIGYFVNSIVMRTSLEGEPSFTELLTRIKTTSLEAFSNQAVPFDKLVAELKPERLSNQNPIFQTMFVFQNAPLPDLELPGLKVTPLEIDKKGATFDLTLEIWHTSKGFQCNFEYNTDLFDTDMIERMGGHFQTLLESILANPQKKISKLKMLTPAEEHQILHEFNDTDAPYPKDKTIHQLFEEQVEKTPSNIACIFEEQELTYKELNKRANKLAHSLRKKGVKPDTIVGIMVERSFEIIIGLLGILKAGGAYLPLDPEYPAKRLEYMLEDSAAKILLTQEKLSESIKELKFEHDVIYLDGVSELDESEENPGKVNKPEDLVYVIYTSGSTGVPKGVMIEHKSLINISIDWKTIYKLGDGKHNHLQMANYSFDVFCGDIARSILYGDCLILCKQVDILDPKKLFTLIKKYKITTAEFIPSVINNLIKFLKKEKINIKTFKNIIVGSDKWDYTDLTQIKRFMSSNNTRIFNSYGTTETTIDSTFFNCTSFINKDTKNIPIGKSFPCSKVLIVNNTHQINPINIPGEIVISGSGLARGYINNQKLTNSKFIKSTFFKSKFYKTNDFGKMSKINNIEYISRKDHQLKINGRRVDPSEIEYAILKHCTIEKCVVIKSEYKKNRYTLNAYITTLKKTPLDISSIKSTLYNYLPPHMVPYNFIQLTSFPLNKNGKVDTTKIEKSRKIIPNNKNHSALIKPSSDLEKSIYSVWKKQLNIEQLSIDDNFFQIGGQSLQAIWMVNEISKIINRDLSLQSFLTNPSIKGLAKYIKTNKPINQQKNITQINKIISNTKIFLLHDTSGNTSIYKNLVTRLDSYSVFGINSIYIQNPRKKIHKISSIAKEYAKEIASIQPKNSINLLGWCSGGILAYQVALELINLGRHISNAFLIETFLTPPLSKDFKETHISNDIQDILFIIEDISRKLNTPPPNIAIHEIPQFSSTHKKAEYIYKTIKPLIKKLHLEKKHLVFLIKIYLKNNKTIKSFKLPSTKINARIIYSSDSNIKNSKKHHIPWKEIYSEKKYFYQISGNHYSIMNLSNSKALALHINNTLKRS
jgi:amino acid adenylation domain-containing protein